MRPRRHFAQSEFNLERKLPAGTVQGAYLCSTNDKEDIFPVKPAVLIGVPMFLAFMATTLLAKNIEPK